MKRNFLMTIAFFGCVTVGTSGHSLPGPNTTLALLGSSGPSTGLSPARLDPDLVAFFTGHWKGEGAFAGGQKIAAEVSFAPSLDSAWLVYEHRDVPPGAYKATSMWGVDGTGQFVAFTFDNFQGHRQWLSSGWAGGKLVLSTGGYSSQAGMVFEHFIYERQSATQFKMTYEVSRDGITWRLGDWLVFTRE
jgi:hypothetical protein